MERKPSNIIRHNAARRGLEPVDFRMMLAPERVIDLEQVSKDDVLERLVELTISSDRVSNAAAFRRSIFEREKLLSTGVGNGVGIPHVKIPQVTDFVMSVGRSARGIDYGAQDGKPVHLVIMIGANDSQSNAFLTVLARLMMRLKNQSFRDSLLESESPQAVYRLLTGEYRNS